MESQRRLPAATPQTHCRGAVLGAPGSVACRDVPFRVAIQQCKSVTFGVTARYQPDAHWAKVQICFARAFEQRTLMTVQSSIGFPSSPKVTEMLIVPVAGHDDMLLNLSGAHAPFFTRNVVILRDNAGRTGVGEVPGGERIRQTLEDARPLVVGRPIGEYNLILSAVRQRFADRDTGRTRIADLRPARGHSCHHGAGSIAARPFGPVPRRSGGGTPGRRTATRCRGDAWLPFLCW